MSPSPCEHLHLFTCKPKNNGLNIDVFFVTCEQSFKNDVFVASLWNLNTAMTNGNGHITLCNCDIFRPQTFQRGNTQISKKFHYPKFEKSWGFMGSLDHLSSGGILFINCLLNVTKNFTWKRVSQLIYLIKSFSFNRWPWRSTIIRRLFLLLLLLFCFRKI